MKKRYSIILLSFLLLILLKIFSVTYGFFETIINENTSLTSLTTQSEYLAVEYSDGTSIMNFDGDFLFPGDTAEKTFTVENTGEADTTYSILIDNVVNEFTRTQDLRYTLYIDNEEITSGAINNNEVQYLYYNREIAVGTKEEVKFIFEYSETEEIQNEDMNKNINFRFNITSKRNQVETTDDGSVTLISNETTLNNYRIYGNSIQDGTPTPEAPIEIETVGDLVTDESDSHYGKYKIPITVSGKNLINVSDRNVSYTNSYYANTFPNNPSVLLETNTTYTFSFDYVINSATSNISVGIGYGTSYYAVDLVYGRLYPTQGKGRAVVTFTTPSSFNDSFTPNLQFRLVRTDSASNVNVDISNLQFEKGDNATDYEPYIEPTTYNIYLDEPLRKVGDVYDYIDFKEQMLYRNIKETILDGNRQWSIYNYNNGTYSGFYALDALDASYMRISGLSNYTNNIGDVWSGDNRLWLGVNGKVINFVFPSSYYDDSLDDKGLENFKSALNTTPMIIQYPTSLAKSIPFELPEITLHEYTNVITIDTETSPSTFEVEVTK